jgi:glycogen operon protein
VNFLAAHDGFTLADTVTYTERNNWANGEQNRDGHADNFSWNHGVEGPSDTPGVDAARRADILAMLETLIASKGTILLCAGDEFGRTQCGNNNAYAQDNHLTWLRWDSRDEDLEAEVARMSQSRAQRMEWFKSFPERGEWLDLAGLPMTIASWESLATPGLRFHSADPTHPRHLVVDRDNRAVTWSV